MADNQTLPDGCELLIAGEACDVVLCSKARKMLMKKATTEQRAQLEDLIERYAEMGLAGMPAAKINTKECWHPSDKAPNKIRIQAFKPWQLRAYGFERQFNGKPTFFITGIDPAKKQDRARPEILEAAGAEAQRLNALLDQKKI